MLYFCLARTKVLLLRQFSNSVARLYSYNSGESGHGLGLSSINFTPWGDFILAGHFLCFKFFLSITLFKKKVILIIAMNKYIYIHTFDIKFRTYAHHVILSAIARDLSLCIWKWLIYPPERGQKYHFMHVTFEMCKYVKC